MLNRLGLTVSPQITKMIALAAFAMVLLAGFGFPAFWPKWFIPAAGAFLGLFGVRDPKAFLVAGLALFAAKFGLQFLPVIGWYTEEIADHLIALVAPAMLVVSIRSIYYQLVK